MSFRGILSLAVTIVIFLITMTVLLGSWYTIDQGERGVVLRNGAMIATAEPGLHFKTPWVESIVKIPVTQQSIHWTHGKEDSQLSAYSQDQQPATMDVSVIYHVSSADVEQVYAQYGGLDGLEGRLIDRRVPQALKTVFGQFTAVSVIQDRAKFNAQVQDAVIKGISGPLVIDSVQVENIDFSEVYEKSVEAAMQARVEVQRMEQQQQQQEVQAKITVINAQAQADATLAQARAAAQAVTIQGAAQADAIRAKGAALRDNPALIEYTAVGNGWDGKLPVTMIPGTTLPFIGVK